MRHIANWGGRGIRQMALSGIVVAIMTGLAPPAFGNQATPVGNEVADECGAAPRSVDEIIALAASLPDEVKSFGTPFPPGPPPDAATMAAISATVLQLEACINTGDFLRVLALFSDDGAMFRGWPLTKEFIAEFRAMEEVAPTPASEGSRQVLIGPWVPRVLDDGRVAAAVLFTYENETPFAEATKALFFVERDGRWLIDEWTESVLVPGRELSAQVEHAVEPPPGIVIERWPPYRDHEVRPAKRKNRRDTTKDAARGANSAPPLPCSSARIASTPASHWVNPAAPHPRPH